MTTIALSAALILIGVMFIMLTRRNAIIRDQGKEIDALRRENIRLKREAGARATPTMSDASLAAAYGLTNPRKMSDADAKEFLRKARDARNRRAAEEAARKRRAEEEDRAAAERRQQPHPTSDPVGLPPHIITMMQDAPAERPEPKETTRVEPAAEKSAEKRSGGFGGDDSFETGGSIRSSGFETGASFGSSSSSSSSDSSSSSSSSDSSSSSSSD